MLLLCIVFIRLLYEPLDVGAARNLVLDQTRELLPGWDVSFENATVGWDWRSVRPWVSITNFRLIDRRERLTAYIPEARVGVAFSGMFTDLSFSTVEVDQARILVADLGVVSAMRQRRAHQKVCLAAQASLNRTCFVRWRKPSAASARA